MDKRMKNLLIISLGILALIITFTLGNNYYLKADQSQKPIHHVVLLKLKPDAAEENLPPIIVAGEELLSQIPGVLEVELGTKARDERAVHFKDYDLGVYVKMSQVSDLDVYGPHEKHLAFIDQASPKLDLIQVLDFYGE